MAASRSQSLQQLEHLWEQYAQEYLKSLPLEHFMESTAQSTQRSITSASFDLVRLQRPDIQLFGELLVQYPRPGQKRPGQVVPDNMVVVSKKKIRADLSFSLPLQPELPFWVMEYVSKGNERKDYVVSRRKYEEDLKVPYYLLFYPDKGELLLLKLVEGAYVAITPNEAGRLPVPELDIEVGLLEGWVRYWFRGELLPLPADLQRELDEIREKLQQARKQLKQERSRARKEEQRAEEQRQRAEQAEQRAEEERQRAEQEKQRADRMQAENDARERELAELRAALEAARRRNGPRTNGAS